MLPSRRGQVVKRDRTHVRSTHWIRSANIALGTVKFFDEAHDYGFITLDESGEDLPAHRSEFGTSGLKTLTAGQRVTFDIVEGDQGKVPVNIQAA